MMLWSEHLLILRDILINEQAARNAIIDMAGGLAAIAEIKRRLASQPPITVGGDGPQPRVVEGSREGQGPEVLVVEENFPANSPSRKRP
ncbi:hypothetical protein AHAS_Ahas13G0239500 [Arachis hypogaea]